MFNNIGRKIQSYSQLIFAIEVLFCILIGALLGASVGSFIRGEEGQIIGPLVGFFVILIGIFFAWLGQMRLYAYGKIAECCEVMMNTMLQKENGQAAQNAVRKCSCGAVLDADALFCPECGKKVER